MSRRCRGNKQRETVRRFDVSDSFAPEARYFFLRFKAIKPPTMPAPNNNNVLGSGTGVICPTDAKAGCDIPNDNAHAIIPDKTIACNVFIFILSEVM